MASSLFIIGNHQIQFDNPRSIIKDIEELLDIEIMDGTYKNLGGQPKTVKFDEAKFYSSFEHFEHNFDNWNMVKIISNYKPCYEIIIYRKTILLCTNILIKYWRHLLLNEREDESLKTQFQDTIDNWSKIDVVAKMMIEKLNGSQLLYLSDDYENIADKCLEGEIDIQKMIEILTKDYSSTQYN
jgi:hypothetical protein